MDKTTINLVTEELRRSLLASGVRVNNIVMFGSNATGSANEESDLDLIIISDDFINKDIFERCEMTLNAEYETRRKFTLPMDILNMTPAEYKKSLSGKFFETRIVA